MAAIMQSPFKAHTGMLGATEPNQPVTVDNAHFLPPGSVVRLADYFAIIHEKETHELQRRIRRIQARAEIER